MEMHTYTWMIKSSDTLTYLFSTAETVEKARSQILEKLRAIRETTALCKFDSNGTVYEYKSSPLGAKDGVLHLSGMNCATTEELCVESNEDIIMKIVSDAPLHIAPVNSVGFATSSI
jgi:hypothetical protein